MRTHHSREQKIGSLRDTFPLNLVLRGLSDSRKTHMARRSLSSMDRTRHLSSHALRSQEIQCPFSFGPDGTHPQQLRLETGKAHLLQTQFQARSKAFVTTEPENSSAKLHELQFSVRLASLSYPPYRTDYKMRGEVGRGKGIACDYTCVSGGTIRPSFALSSSCPAVSQ